MAFIHPRRTWLLLIAAAAVALSGALVMTSADAEPESALANCGATSRDKPTVVLVHGAWATRPAGTARSAVCWTPAIAVRAIANPLQDLTTDAATVADFLKTIAGPIVLVGHSYGGSVITNAAAGNPNVKALVYVDAAAPDVGETNGSLSGSDLGAERAREHMGRQGLLPRRTRRGDVPVPQEGRLSCGTSATTFPRARRSGCGRRSAARRRPRSTRRRSAAAWKTIPSWYFISSGDQIITPESELVMARRANSKVTLFRGGSHLTLISHPGARDARHRLGHLLRALID